ncbi:MAG: glycosyltransferase family 2 protein [Pseudomonadota bacterium]
MKISVHIGPQVGGAARVQDVLAAKREQLKSKGVLFARTPGPRNHTRLFMAVTDRDHIDPLRFNRGYASEAKQTALREMVVQDLAREVETHTPEHLILSSAQLSTSLHRVSELERLRDMLTPLSRTIQIVATVQDPAQMALESFVLQLEEGRRTPLNRDLDLLSQPDWWTAAIGTVPDIDPAAGVFEETEAAPFWLDLKRLEQHWSGVFGSGNVTFHACGPDAFSDQGFTDNLRDMFGIAPSIGRATGTKPDALPSAATLTRWQSFNALLGHYLSSGEYVVPRQLLRRLHSEMAVNGPPPESSDLSAIATRFAADWEMLSKTHPALASLTPIGPRDSAGWQDADPEFGFRASQYLLSSTYRIGKATRENRDQMLADLPGKMAPAPQPQPDLPKSPDTGLSEIARKLMPPLAVEKFKTLTTSSFAPHNRLGAVDEEQLAAAYPEQPARRLNSGSTGNVIVGCMKNEAPYIVEWVAYHRAIGVDNFLIYTNGCTDGTAEILDRLQAMGILEHRDNDNWKGNSPQQFALNRAMKEPVVTNADWIIHIDVDEFINVRCGNGTLQDFLERVPEATNVAMTWRLFGHNGVTRLADEFVIDQFDTCAPKFCPKPHTVWGFKTMFKNIGAYAKLSCHRPNKLDEALRDQVRWVNGSGRDMTQEAADNGWRSSKKSVGYDLIQLNHYALRSAESFLIKRQRGRALHVDRSIGLNYWIRMDWSDFRDITIKRNLPRLRAEFERLMQDGELAKWHQHGVDWHKAKAEELHGIAEFEELYEQALNVKLTETERVAYALALDLES